jgi:hypothetical protein
MLLNESDICELAESLVADISNRNWADAVTKIKELTPMQSLHVWGVILEFGMLSDRNTSAFLRVISNHLNDGEK